LPGCSTPRHQRKSLRDLSRQSKLLSLRLLRRKSGWICAFFGIFESEKTAFGGPKISAWADVVSRRLFFSVFS
ncbi:hypothetical protein, partial [Agrobacterium albertimagni]|uniref:hypothetical protein n=1 Tax=Agrobacterium albertimagni TaxID=147266 RepID=UPI001AEBC78E